MIRDPDGQLIELLPDSWLAACRRAVGTIAITTFVVVLSAP